MPTISPLLEQAYESQNLHVHPSIMGRCHEFTFEGMTVRVHIPRPNNSDNNFDSFRGLEEVLHVGARNGVTEEPLSYLVYYVCVQILLPEAINLPKELLDNAPHNGLHSNNMAVNKCFDYCEVGDKAFMYWLETVRWVTDKFSIGKETYYIKHTGRSASLINESDGNPIDRYMLIQGSVDSQVLIVDQWDVIQQHLSNDENCPVHIKLIHDAQSSVANRQLERAIVELAQAHENYIRNSTMAFLPANLRQDFVDQIELTNFNQYVTHLFNNSLKSEEMKTYKQVKEVLKGLTAKRNEYMHYGKMANVTMGKYHKYLKALRILLELELEHLSPN